MKITLIENPEADENVGGITIDLNEGFETKPDLLETIKKALSQSERLTLKLEGTYKDMELNQSDSEKLEKFLEQFDDIQISAIDLLPEEFQTKRIQIQLDHLLENQKLKHNVSVR
jgi:predicted phage-related endonuclease